MPNAHLALAYLTLAYLAFLAANMVSYAFLLYFVAPRLTGAARSYDVLANAARETYNAWVDGHADDMLNDRLTAKMVELREVLDKT